MKLGSYKIRKEALMNFLQQSEGKDLTNPYHVIEHEHNILTIAKYKCHFCCCLYFLVCYNKRRGDKNGRY